MIRGHLLLVGFMAFIIQSFGQTYYFSQQSVIHGGIRGSGDNTGQFITVTPKGCFDSDSNGYAVNNGFLEYVGFENEIHVYHGDSYWGKAYYYFTKNYTRLNVKLISEDVILVYSENEIPPGVKTSAKIKTNRSEEIPIMVNSPMILPQNQPSNSSSTIVRKNCDWCKGTGRDPSPDDSGIPDFAGTAPEEYCNYCKHVRRRHIHKMCNQCRGKGFIERINRN